MVSAFVYFADKDKIKEHFKNIHTYIYICLHMYICKHFPRGNANVPDLNKTVIENWTLQKKKSVFVTHFT